MPTAPDSTRFYFVVALSICWIALLPASLAAIRGGVPAWLGWLGVVAGVASLATIFFVGTFAWMAWILVASIVLLFAREA